MHSIHYQPSFIVCFYRLLFLFAKRVWFVEIKTSDRLDLPRAFHMTNFQRKMSKFGRRIKQAPAGFDYVEPTLTALDNELRDSK